MNYVTAVVQLPLVKEATKDEIRMPADAARVCSDIADLAQETFHVLLLNGKNCLINRQMVSLGLVNSSLAHSREVFRPAIEFGASALVVVHNHPSGQTAPSAEDVKVTKQLVEAGKILGIAVQDHVIVGWSPKTGSNYLSMREQGLCDFSAAA